MSAFAIEASKNMKTGTVHATYASQQSCPTTCPLRGAGCYAEHGPMGIWTAHVNKANPNATPLDVALAEAEAISETLSGRLDLRLHVVGDCPTDESAQIVSSAALAVLKRGRQAWSYTHAAAGVERTSWDAVSILASGETTEQMKAYQARGYATALVVPEFKSEKLYVQDGIKILPCPNQTRGVQCVDCRLCMNDTRLREKGITIAFEPHGSRFKKVKRMLTVLQ
jgi:hypothetical protein